MRLLVLAALAGLLGSTGCNQTVAEVQKKQESVNEVSIILSQLQQERMTMATFRTMMEQLNSHYDHHGDSTKKQLDMPPEQETAMREALSQISSDFDRARRVDDAKSRLFNSAADASYLDACLLFRDAVTAIENEIGERPPSSDAAALLKHRMDFLHYLHSWTMRQVALRQNPPNIKDWPPHEILRLGAGDADDRLRVFLGLLDQTDIDSCAVVVKTQVRQDDIVEDRQMPILAGVLVDGKLYLFDPHSGKPVPSETPGGIATWEELKKNPSLLAARPQTPTPTQLAESELVLLVSLPSLAPRMGVLEKEFDNIKIAVKLLNDPAEQVERFKAAGYTVKPWAAPKRNGFPALVFHRYVESSRIDPRLNEELLPHERLIPDWARAVEKNIRATASPQSLYSEFDRLLVRVRLEPGSGRDLLVRGKPHQAVERLSRFENNLYRAMDQFKKDMPHSLPNFRTMEMVEFQAACARLTEMNQRLRAAAPGSAEERELSSTRLGMLSQLEMYWRSPTVRLMVNNLGAYWASPELREHLTYFMGLAKMELALRAEMRHRKNPAAAWPADIPTPAEQFASAADWFRRYEALVIPTDSHIWLDAVKLRQQECREKIAELTGEAAQANR